MEHSGSKNTSSVRDYLRVIFRHKTVILVTFLTMIITAIAGLQLKTPEYEARVKMLILARKYIDSPYYKEMPEFRPTEITLTQSEIVKSNPVIERVVKRLRLNELPTDYEKNFSSPLKSIFIDLKVKKLNGKLQRFSAEKKNEYFFRRSVQELKKKITVEPIKDTDLFTITVTDFSPEMAARIANTVSRSYCLFDLEQQMAELQQKYGNKHLFITQLKENIRKLESNIGEDLISDIEAIGPASVKIIEQAAIPIEPVKTYKIQTLILAFFMSTFFGILLAFLFERFDSTFKSPQELKDFQNIPLLGYIPALRSFMINLVCVFSRIITILLITVALLVFSRGLVNWVTQDTNNLLVRFLNKITDPVIFPVKSIIPLQFKTGFELYSFLSFVILVFLNILIVKIISGAAKIIVRKKTFIKNLRKINKYFQAYQNLGEQIYLSMNENKKKSLLITSALQGEGNSTIVANLGFYLALKAGYNILIVDANLRKPSLHKAFKLQRHPGLMEVLRGKASFEETVKEINSNLHILTAGENVFDPLAFLDSPHMTQIIKTAEEKFDLILFDCANLKDFKDGTSLSSYVKAVALVVNERKTRREVFRAAIAPLEQKNISFIGVIFNNRTFSIPKLIYDLS